MLICVWVKLTSCLSFLLSCRLDVRLPFQYLWRKVLTVRWSCWSLDHHVVFYAPAPDVVAAVHAGSNTKAILEKWTCMSSLIFSFFFLFYIHSPTGENQDTSMLVLGQLEARSQLCLFQIVLFFKTHKAWWNIWLCEVVTPWLRCWPTDRRVVNLHPTLSKALNP